MKLQDQAVELLAQSTYEAKMFGFILSNLCIIQPEYSEIECGILESNEDSRTNHYTVKLIEPVQNEYLIFSFLKFNSSDSKINVFFTDERDYVIRESEQLVPKDLIEFELEEFCKFFRNIGLNSEHMSSRE